VYSGDVEESFMLHGRVGRWERMVEIFDNSSFAVQFLGFPVGLERPYNYLTVGPHNDFLRNLFCSGYIGLICYVLFLINIFGRIIKHEISMVYLGLGALACLILYSIATTPTLYTSFLYIVLSIFAYFTIPLRVARLQENAKK